MLYLILAILSSTLVSVFMRVSETRVRSTMVMFMANYAVCALVALGYLTGGSLLPRESGGGYALLLGIVGGGLFLGSFALLRLNIRKNGMVLSALFMKLGVLVPIVIAVCFFRERPTSVQILGFLLAVAAILVMNLGGSSVGRISAGSIWLIVLLLAGGLTDSLINIYDKTGAAAWKEHFLLLIFVSACAICLVWTVVRKQPVLLPDLLFGGLIGIPNYYSTRFLMLSLINVKAVVAYPVYNAGSIILITLAGVLAFRESLNRRKIIGICLILAALILLNL